MAIKTRYRDHSYVIKNAEDPYSKSKTEKQWRAEGRAIAGRGEVMYTNQFRQILATYFAPEETREATPEEVAAWKAEENEKKRKQRQERKEEERAALEAEEARKDAHIKRLRRFVGIDPADIICLDTETTGVGYDDEILQLSIIDGRGEVLIDDFFRPKTVTEWPEAQSIHGISPDAVAQCPHIDSCIPRVNEILSNAKLIVGYNMGFDLDFIRRAGITIPDSINQFDCMPEFAEIYGEWNSYFKNYRWQKLCLCADFFGYEGTGFHDSLEDVRATLFCYFAMMEYNYGR